MTIKNNSLAFNYPIYTVSPLNRNSLVIAGGGGAVKTGVQNRIDIVDCSHSNLPPYGVQTQVAGGIDTGTEAVMSLVVLSQGKGAFFITLEGCRCVEYFAQLKTDSSESNVIANFSDKQYREQLRNHETSVPTQSEVSLRHRNKKDVKSVTKALGGIVKEMKTSDKHSSNIGDKDSVEWELVKIRDHALSDENSVVDSGSESPSNSPSVSFGLPNCAAQNSSSCCTFVAIGSTRGTVCFINHGLYTIEQGNLTKSNEQPLFVFPDVSGGHSTSVCSMAIGPFEVKADHLNQLMLATICDQPDWNNLRVWKLPPHLHSTNTLNSANELKHLTGKIPYAVALLNNFDLFKQNSNTSVGTKSNNNAQCHPSYRFHHCQFMNYRLSVTNEQLPRLDTNLLLVTTTQPVCANRHSGSYLVVWSVPIPPSTISNSLDGKVYNQLSAGEPLNLKMLCSASLPPGQIPSCLSTHPSRYRGLIATGTMDGHIDVYFLSPITRQLICVYTVRNAHPIFVTSLTFMPSYAPFVGASASSSLPSQTFSFASVSVDRMLKWHTGPTYALVNKLSHGLIQSQPITVNDYLLSAANWVADSSAHLICLLILLFLPMYLVIIEHVIVSFFL